MLILGTHMNCLSFFSLGKTAPPRYDSRTHWPQRHGELSRYMSAPPYLLILRTLLLLIFSFFAPCPSSPLCSPRYAYWRIDPNAPAGQMDVRRKPSQCGRAAFL